MIYQPLAPTALIESVARADIPERSKVIRPAENSWHLVIVRRVGQSRAVLVGPWTGSGLTTLPEDAEVLWLKFRLGTALSGQPIQTYRDQELMLPAATQHSFWLNDRAWPLPTFDDAALVAERLERVGGLTFDPLIDEVLQGVTSDLASRTVRHRLVQATGLSLNHIRQVQRAQQAAEMLRQGVAIADTLYRTGYFDQPHLTRSLRRWIGHTPAQLRRTSR